MRAAAAPRDRAVATAAARYPDAFRHRKERIARVQMQALLAGIEVVELRGDPTVDVVALTHDSRQVAPGALFACIPGARTDGHDHAPAAVDAGAVALLVERPLDLGPEGALVAEAIVPSVRGVLGPVAARFHGEPSKALSCLGVTGTNGKTTTTYLLEAIARAAGRRVGLIGTTGARIDGHPVALDHTTPEATELQALLARMRDAGIGTVAMEVSSHALVQGRVDGTHFSAVCFTNLSHDHLDFHGGLEQYFEAKARLVTPEFTKHAAVNVADPHGRTIAERASAAGVDVVAFALEHDADVTAADVSLDGRGARFTIVDSRAGRSALVRTDLLGRHNVENALAAAATALAAGLELDAVVSGLGSVPGVPGRLEPVTTGRRFSVLVDYAHTPDALSHALAATRELAGRHRVIVVFGCGGDRDRAKRPAMGAVATRAADLTIVTSDNPRSERPSDIADEIVGGAVAGAHVRVELDRRAAIRDAIRGAEPGDVVLIAGKGHETGQTAGGVTRPFDDRVVAREELGARR